jgi:alkylation response protein AidB-like acyl-CoA dehydrogenase
LAGKGDLVTERLEELLAAHDPRQEEPPDFFGHQFDAGLANLAWPIGLGGLGLGGSGPAGWSQGEVERRLRDAGAKSALLRNPLGVGMGLPTLLQWGTSSQQQAWCRPCFTTEHVWCQLFSEPGAGSDLASLATRAVRDGDDWMVQGQKVWTSLAHVARIGMLLARTDPSAPKHRGLTFFLVDMTAPGVTVRPLRQMTGEIEFNEVFLDNVRVPDARRVGEIGDGWRVATTTLMNERVVLSGSGTGSSGNVGGAKMASVLALARETGASSRPVVRDALVSRWMEATVIRLLNQRTRALRAAGRPGPEGSLAKLAQGLHNRRLQQTAVQLLGAGGQAFVPGSSLAGSSIQGFLRAQGNTIEGGTSNILRNVIGERVLGLPREPGPDKDTPWDQLPRS